VPVPDRETLLEWLAAKAEDRAAPHDVSAIKALLEELRRDGDEDEQPGTLDALDNVTSIDSRRQTGA
jgi:hypothetical protein